MLKDGFPVTMAKLSTPRLDFPMILKSFGSLSFGVADGVIFAALSSKFP